MIFRPFKSTVLLTFLVWHLIIYEEQEFPFEFKWLIEIQSNYWIILDVIWMKQMDGLNVSHSVGRFMSTLFTLIETNTSDTALATKRQHWLPTKDA